MHGTHTSNGATDLAIGEEPADGALQPYARRLAPGLSERHQPACLKSIAWPRARCTCAVAYDAWLRHDDGPEHRTFPTRDSAESWLREIRATVRNTEPPQLAEAVEAFLVRAASGASPALSGCLYRQSTVASYRRALNLRVLPFRPRRDAAPIGRRHIDTIDGGALQAAVDAAVERYGSAVARVTCSAIRALFRDLIERGEIEKVPEFPQLPQHDRPATRLAYSPPEIERILRAARSDDDRHERSLIEPLIVLILGSGASVPAALRTRWSADSLDVDARAPHVRLERPTRRHGLVTETVGLAPTVAAMLRRHRDRLGAIGDGSLVFPAKAGDRPATTELVHAALRRIARAADVPRLSPYALRHTGATWADRAINDTPLDLPAGFEEA